MRIDRLAIPKFGNLEDFEIDFDEDEFATVLIGENGTGKLNLIEAIVQIFGDLDLGQPSSFAYEIRYVCRGKLIEVKARAGERQEVRVLAPEATEIPWTRFMRSKDDLLPRY